MSEPKLSHRACPLCSRDNRNEPASRWSRDEWTIKECPECEFIYLENAPEYEALADDYCWTLSVPQERNRRLQSEPLFSRLSQSWKQVWGRTLPRGKCEWLAQRFCQPGSVVDLGCGSGSLLKKMGDRFVPHGIEIDPHAAALARQVVEPRGGSIVECDVLRGLRQFPEASMSGVVMKCYLEHETAPADVLRAAERILQPGGHLVIKVPNIGCWNFRMRGKKWCGFRFPDHVNYFTPETLQKIVQNAGFEVARFQWNDHFPLGDNMYLVAQRPESAAVAEPLRRVA
ncbi:MAG: class I SAM-dependent methyltransferase [Planctomycetaceae bacterium]|nr:class I SAM-dependent methyltransferase [Planctomycetaceae bacterium]